MLFLGQRIEQFMMNDGVLDYINVKKSTIMKNRMQSQNLKPEPK